MPETVDDVRAAGGDGYRGARPGEEEVRRPVPSRRFEGAAGVAGPAAEGGCGCPDSAAQLSCWMRLHSPVPSPTPLVSSSRGGELCRIEVSLLAAAEELQAGGETPRHGKSACDAMMCD